MTAPTAAKSAPKSATNKAVTETANVAGPKVDERIPESLSNNPILADFCKQYLAVVDEISDYNKAVLAEKSSEWTTVKVLEKAREFGSPDDATQVKPEVKSALDKWQDLVAQTAKARKAVLDATSKELGITLSATAERDPEIEGPLKDKRKLASELGNQLSYIAKLTTDSAAGDSVTKFLNDSPLPAIGRDQTRSFGTDEKATPKYRVTVEVTNKDGEVVVSEAGFTKAALALPKYFERGQSPKSDHLRKLWENAGNTPENTVQNPVVNEYQGYTFTITKK
jgi:hypothetical protein